MIQIEKALEKTAALLEAQAEKLEREEFIRKQKKRNKFAADLTPILQQYQQETGQEIPEDQMAALLNEEDSPLVPILQQLLANEAESGELGAPEDDENSIPSEEETPEGLEDGGAAMMAALGGGKSASRKVAHSNGRRREAHELRRNTIRQEQAILARYQQR